MSKQMRVPDEMIEILELMRKRVTKYTRDAIDYDNVDLFRVLAKKIKDYDLMGKP